MSEFMLIDLILLMLCTITAVAVVEMRNLFASSMLMAIYSLILALVWVNMDAVDVAFTEAAVGAGISTILLIGTLVIVGTDEKRTHRAHWPALLAVIFCGAALAYGTLDMPPFGSPDNPAQQYALYDGYTKQNVKKIARPADDHSQHTPVGEASIGPAEHADYFHGHVPNQVTAVIVSYRAFDTLFETAVIFTAGLSMILLLRGRKRRRGFEGGLK